MTLNHSLVKQFTIIILLATLASLIPYFLTTMSELVIFFKYPGLFKKTRKLFGSVFIAVLAGIYSFWVIIGSGKETVFYGTLLLLSSAPVYVWMKWHASLDKSNLNVNEQPLPLRLP
jgi:APA family basic amino acid/polyamine antiporter